MKKRDRQAAPLAPAVWNRVLGRTPTSRVAMFHVGRSGSGVLADLVGQHSGVSWDGEVVEHNRSLWSRADRFDRFVARRSAAAGRCIYGLELKFFHARLLDMPLDDLFARLDALGFDRFVILERRNLLRKVVSSAVYHANRKAHIAAGRAPERIRVEIDPAELRIDRIALPLIEHLDGYRDGFRWLRERLAGRDVLELTYEDDVAKDPGAGYRKTCGFLGLSDEEPDIRFARTNPFPMSEIVANWPDVEAALRGSEYEWMLES